MTLNSGAANSVLAGAGIQPDASAPPSPPLDQQVQVLINSSGSSREPSQKG